MANLIEILLLAIDESGDTIGRTQREAPMTPELQQEVIAAVKAWAKAHQDWRDADVSAMAHEAITLCFEPLVRAEATLLALANTISKE